MAMTVTAKEGHPYTLINDPFSLFFFSKDISTMFGLIPQILLFFLG
jgi:hypothetical protein